MQVSEYIAKFFKYKGIDTVFELQGGMITRIIDAIYKEGKIDIVSMHHEQSAAFAVDGYSRVKNKPAVALATSGPGATNLLTGVGSCYYDSVAAIFITGQVNINEQKGERNIRQLGFQETDIVSIVKPITKLAIAIKDPKKVPEVFENAYNTALNGRPGPVLIDIPMDIQNSNIEVSMLDKPHDCGSIFKQNIFELENFISNYTNELKKSERPLLLLGRGIRAGGATNLLRTFVDKFKVPVVTSLLGWDIIPYSSEHRVGFIGTYGNRWANMALANSDLLLVLGSRLDIRQTGNDLESFMAGKKVFHLDIDENELNNRLDDCITIKSDIKIFLESIIKRDNIKSIARWKDEVQKYYTENTDIEELKNIIGINPNIFLHNLSKISKHAKVISVDVGNNQMWAAQSYELLHNQLFITSGGMGAMGYALPAAIGACFSVQKSPVLVISGDGGFQLNIQELETIVRNKLPVKIVIINNNSLGMIRQFQDSYFDSCHKSSVWGYSCPDFVKIGLAYGIPSSSIKNPTEVESALKLLWENPNKPYILNVIIDVKTNVFPKLSFGNTLTNMDRE